MCIKEAAKIYIYIYIKMAKKLNNSFNSFNNLNNSNLDTSPLSGTNNITSYISSPNNILELVNQESQSNQNSDGETPQLNINISQNTKTVENKDNTNDDEIPGNTVETKNTTNPITFNRIEIIPTIRSFVCTANLNCKLDLREIALQAKNVEYNPKRFSALIMDIKEPKSRVKVFSNGIIQSSGTPTVEQSKNACRKCAKDIKKFGYNVHLTNFKIISVMGSCKLKFKIRLRDLFCHIRNKMNLVAFYEPEHFPALKFYYLTPTLNSDDGNKKKPNIVFLIYSTGGIVITGARTVNQIYEAFQRVYPLLYIHQQFD